MSRHPLSVSRIIILSIAFLFVMCACMSTGGSETLSPDEVSEATLQAMVNEIWETREAEEMKATATSMPTPTIVITETPKATPTPEIGQVELEYISRITELGYDCADYLGSISTLSTQAGTDITLIFDDDWKLEMAIALAGIKLSCAAIDEVSPVPAGYENVQANLEAGAREYDLFVDDMIAGLDEMDPDKLDSAMVHMQQGTDYIKKATDDMMEIR